MAAYFISDASVKNREALGMFRARALASITRYGGRYLERAGLVEPVEGDWKPSAIIVIEFPVWSGRGLGIDPPNMPRRSRSATTPSAAT